MKIKKHIFDDRNLTKQLKWPTLSWSMMSAWSYAKTDHLKWEWYLQYVQGQPSMLNSTMSAGIEIGRQLIANPKFLPEVPRPEIYEYNLSSKIGDIAITGHMDGWSPKTKELLEYKTTAREGRWTSDEVDNHHQIDFYCLLLFLNHKIKPSDIKIKLVAIPTKETGNFEVKLDTSKEVKIFQTNRTMKDILLFSSEIKRVYKEMELFVKNHG